MIEIKRDGYYVGIWFLGDGETMDWLGIVERLANGEHKLSYRFRYYHPESKDPFDGKDTKSGTWTALFPADRAEADVCAIVDGLVDDLAQRVRPESRYRLMVQGDGERFSEVFGAAPFTHLSTPDGEMATPTARGPGGQH